MIELQEEIKRLLDEKEAKMGSRKKTIQQLEKEAKEKEIEAARNRSIGSIYKQLAKMIHPDLEQDPKLKMIKGEQMQKLTSAYESGDLHTLLSLELEWLKVEENNLQKLSDEKLGIYNELLKEQVEELQDEINLLPGNPRYFQLQPYYNIWSGFNAHQIEYELISQSKDFDISIKRLQSAHATKEIKALINKFHEFY
jgi:hypothetical protein